MHFLFEIKETIIKLYIALLKGNILPSKIDPKVTEEVRKEYQSIYTKIKAKKRKKKR